MKTILILNQKGGVSKSSCCVELCNFLSQFAHEKPGSNVLGIDLDAQRHLSKFSHSDIVLTETLATGKISECKNVLDVLLGEEYLLNAVQTVQIPKFINKVAMYKEIAHRKAILAEEKKNIRTTISSKAEAARLCRAADSIAKSDIVDIKKGTYEKEAAKPSFDILPASQKLANSAKIFTEMEDIYLLKEVLSDENVQNKYDYCIIDSAPARSPLLNQSLVAADYIIIPTDRDSGAIDGIENTIIDIQNFQKRNMCSAKILGIFLTRWEKQSIQMLLEEEIHETADRFNVPIFKSMTKNSPFAKESRCVQQSIGIYKPNSPLAFEYYDFVKEVRAVIEEDK